MKFAALILGVAVTAAANAAGVQEPLPLPPVPPVQPPPMEAPVPDLDARSPNAAGGPLPVTLDTAINHRASPSLGFGYAPGARYQIDNDRRLFVPGIMLHMPFP